MGVGRLTVGCVHEREDRHVSGIPAIHGLATNLAPGITPLLERQVRHRHLIFSPAIGTFEDDHCFTNASAADDVEGPVIVRRGSLAFIEINYRGSS